MAFNRLVIQVAGNRAAEAAQKNFGQISTINFGRSATTYPGSPFSDGGGHRRSESETVDTSV